MPQFSLRSRSAILVMACALVALPLWGQTSGQQTAPVITNGASIDGIATADKDTAKKLKAEDNVALIGKRKVGHGWDFYSQQKEIELGRGLSEQVMQESTVVTDPVINEYINRLAQNLVRNSDAKVPFTVHVLQDDTVNAFALPGGFFFVNSGLILGMQEEDELAGAMAHEIAHVAARHGTRNATKGELLSILTIPAMIAAGPGLGGLAVQEGANVALPLQFQRFTRGAEQEADWLGTQYLWKAGYDPQGMARAFEVLASEEKQKPGFVSRLFASHPQDANRVALTEKEIATILPARADYVVTTSDFHSVQARLRALLKSKIEAGVKIPGGLPAAAAQAPKVGGPPVIKH